MTRIVTIRHFTDSKGVSWRVWATYPVHAATIAAQFRDGWLTFQSGSVRRRLAPVPAHWQDVADKRLELLCANADGVQDRGSRNDLTLGSIDELVD